MYHGRCFGNFLISSWIVAHGTKVLQLHNTDIYPLLALLAYQGKYIVFRFILEYSSFGDFGP
jgi:hypothetical protein